MTEKKDYPPFLKTTAEETLELFVEFDPIFLRNLLTSEEFREHYREASEFVQKTNNESAFTVFTSAENPSEVIFSDLTEGELESVNTNDDKTQKNIYDLGKTPIRIIDFHFHPDREKSYALVPSIDSGRGGDISYLSDIPFESFDMEKNVSYMLKPLMVVGKTYEDGSYEFIIIQDLWRNKRSSNDLKLLDELIDTKNNNDHIIKMLADSGFKAAYFKVQRNGDISREDRQKLKSFKLPVYKIALTSEEQLRHAESVMEDLDGGDNEKEKRPPENLENKIFAIKKLLKSISPEDSKIDFDSLAQNLYSLLQETGGNLSIEDFKHPNDISFVLYHSFNPKRFALSQEELEKRISQNEERLRNNIGRYESLPFLKEKIEEELSIYEPNFTGYSVAAILSVTDEYKTLSFIIEDEWPIKMSEIIDELNDFVDEEFADDPDSFLVTAFSLEKIWDFLNFIEAKKEIDKILNFEQFEDYFILLNDLFKMKTVDLQGAYSEKIIEDIGLIKQKIIEICRKDKFFRSEVADYFLDPF